MLLLFAAILALIFLPWPWSSAAVFGAAAVEVAIMTLGARYNRRQPPSVGVEALIGRTAMAITPLTPKGQVKIDGEIWQGRATRSVLAGEMVRVCGVYGLTLEVD